MLKKQIGSLSLIIGLILTTTPAVLGAEITVNSTSGTDAQNAINSAIDFIASNATPNNQGYILLTAGNYQVSAPIVLKSNIVLKGAGDNTIIFAANSSVCNSVTEPAYIYGSGVSNIEVSDLQFKGTATGTGDGGHGDYRNCIQFRSSSNSTVHDILFTRYLYRDGVVTSRSSGINVYNCRMYSTGHDGVAFLSASKNCRMYNCDVQIQTNTGVRIDNSANCEVDHNTFTSGTAGSGWCCVELENALTNANVHHNIMHDFRGSSNSAGIGNVRASGSITVQDNVMWNVSPYIQIGSGTNILGPSDHNVANWVAKGYGYGSIGNPTDQELPVASFTSSTTSGNTPLSVAFTDTSTGTPTSWSWDFGDGTTSPDQNPTHTYSTAGNYAVSLKVTNNAGSNTTTKTDYVIVLTPAPAEIPVADFSSNITSGNKPLTVAFTDTSTKSPTAWNWSFGDGTSSIEQNPTHTYFAAGTYTVNLTVSNGNGTASKLAKITVLSGQSIPVFPGYTNPSTDPNHDGLYEDINGNGILDFDDVVAYNDNMDWIGTNAPVALFDYNKNNLIDFDDVVKLNDML
jgi:parallel beta-helix repeat protein